MATLIKLDSARYPIGELVCFRSFFALIPVLAWVMWRGQFPSVFHTQRIGRHFLRSVSGASTMFLGFTALSLLPIADATAIGYAAPLMTVVLAVVFLGEKVRIYRWSAVIVGVPLPLLYSPGVSWATTLVIPWIIAQVPAALLAAGIYGILEGWLAVDGARDWWPMRPPEDHDVVDFGLHPDDLTMPPTPFNTINEAPLGERTPIRRDAEHHV